MDGVKTVTACHLSDAIRQVIRRRLTEVRDADGFTTYSFNGVPFMHSWMDKEDGKIVWRVEELDA